jgi:hypothetical protein
VNFQTNRTHLPLIYIATSYDANKKYSLWTKNKPELPTLCRTILLAKECLKKIESFSLNLNNFENFKVCFDSKRLILFLSNYDFKRVYSDQAQIFMMQ